MQWILTYLPNFLLIFCRITSFFVVAPIFSFRGVPVQFKIGLSFFVTLLVFSAVGMEEPAAFDYTYLLSVIREVLVGLVLGFTAYLFFTAVQVSGSFVDLQMGFGIANVVDPLTGTQSPVIGNFKFIIAILLFLAVNGHHYLLHGLMDSYRWVPISNELFARIYRGDVSNFLLDSFIQMFYLAFQLAAPLIVSLFLADVALGILARTAPQFNIFVVGLPFKIMLGFVVILVMIPGFLFLFQHLFQTLFESMRQLVLILQSA